MLSHTGRVRKSNEDACAGSRELGVFVVCDGIGGAAAGEVASRMATETFLKSLTPPDDGTPRTATPDVRLDQAIRAANDQVYGYARQSAELRGMGTTLVALLVEMERSGPGLTLAHVGDSRCYVLRDGVLKRLTDDHSLVQEHVQMGDMTPEEAAVHPMRNIITRAVGSQEVVEPEIMPLKAAPGDLYLLASDGLTRDLTDADLVQILKRAQAKAEGGQPNLDSLCRTLVDEANDAGGGDNVTVLLLQMA